jgi:hypothetical protein
MDAKIEVPADSCIIAIPAFSRGSESFATGQYIWRGLRFTGGRHLKVVREARGLKSLRLGQIL